MGQSLAAQKAYVDYAAERHWPYEAVDAGWYFRTDAWDTTDPNWQTDSWMPQLVDYARAKGVGIVVWIHQRNLDTPAWDDTRLLAGQPGREAVLARRSGDRWFLGGVYAGAARTAEVPLSVGAGRWLVETIRDGADGLVQRRQVLRGGDTLADDVVANGGFAGIACRWHPGVTTCYR